jgi:uncharacterized protein (DUF433 family)
MVQPLATPVTHWTHCRLVEAVPGKVSGGPILKGTRMPADAIPDNDASGLPADEIAEVFQLPANSARLRGHSPAGRIERLERIGAMNRA